MWCRWGGRAGSACLGVALLLVALPTCAGTAEASCTIPDGFPSSCSPTAGNCTVVFKFGGGQQCTAYGPYALKYAPAAVGVDCASNGNVIVLWATGEWDTYDPSASGNNTGSGRYAKCGTNSTRRNPLVFCLVNKCSIADAVPDPSCGPGPTERPSLLIPVGEPAHDGPLEPVHAFETAAPNRLPGD